MSKPQDTKTNTNYYQKPVTCTSQEYHRMAGSHLAEKKREQWKNENKEGVKQILEEMPTDRVSSRIFT